MDRGLEHELKHALVDHVSGPFSNGTLDMQRGAIILCGGRSSRMGLPKAELPFGAETMLARVVRLVGEACRLIVVVAAADQRLPELREGVIVARDRRPGRGPLEGLAVGLAALPPEVSAAYVTACDVPLLVPAFVDRMFALLGDHAAAVPVNRERVHALSAVYRRNLLDIVESLLEGDQLRAGRLLDIVATRRVAESELIDVDPLLASLKNVNSPQEYFEALAEAGLSAPPEIIARLAPED
jgi:molybdenum cofactor guanylyltransferase